MASAISHEQQFQSLPSVPFVVSFAVGKRGVQNGHQIAEASCEAPHRLGRKRDLRHEHNGVPAPLDDARDRLEVYLRLARPGHAVQKHRTPVAVRRGRRYGLQRRSLLGVELQGLRAHHGAPRERVAARDPRRNLESAPGGHRPKRGGGRLELAH